MSWLERLWNLVGSRQLDSNLSEELQFHWQSRVRENIASGMSPEEAEWDARRRFGNRTLAWENTREADTLVPLRDVAQDLRYAVRLMGRRPLFTALAVVLVGLGIGVSTAMFSLLVRSVFPRSAFENSNKLVFLWRFDKKQDRFLESFSERDSYAELDVLRHENRSLKVMSIYRFADYIVNLGADPESIPGMEVEPDWLPALGVSPWIGRNLQRGDANGVLVSHELWSKLFQNDAQALGRKLSLDNHPYTIVGVLPEGLDFEGAQIFTPLVTEADSRQRGSLHALATLENGFSPQQAEAEVQAMVAKHENWAIHLATFKEKIANDCGPTCGQRHNGIWLLFVAAILVMLLACANVANLLLARGSGRRHEFLIRTSIGCSRFRLARQILTEIAVLFLFGCALALLLASWLTTALARFAASYVSEGLITGRVPLDSRALLFAALATLMTALLFGGVPVVRSAVALRRESAAPRKNRTRGLLIAAEFALSLVLLVGFGLLLRSFLAVEAIPVGIRTERLLTMTGNVARKYVDPAKRIALARDLLERLRNLPGVSSAALTSSLPLAGADDTRIRVEGEASTPTEVRFVSVSPNFFAMIGLPILAGRAFTEHDAAASAYVVVINETMARTLFPGGDAIGRRIQMDEEPRVWCEITGIAADVRQRNLEEDSRPVFYRPYSQGMAHEISFAVRARSLAEMPQTARAMRETGLKVDADAGWQPVKSMQQLIYDSESLSLRRPIIRLLGAFGVLALLLTAAGLFAVLSYTVMERTREIGIRMAIGARPAQILRQIAGEIARFIAPGALMGAIAAYALSALLPSGHIGWSGSGVFLYGIPRLDAATYAGVVAALCFIALAAAYLPARRAIEIDPAIALREE